MPGSRRLRRAARIVLRGPGNRVLLFRYAAPGFDPFWILPGGECDADEEFDEAATRELLEETGIRARPEPLGHIVEAEYVYFGEAVRSLEHFFHHRTAFSEISTRRHTDLERHVMREYRWFSIEELAGWHETIYPTDLARLLARIIG
ncbi:MAG: NUDIX domain-containing protein, partial [Novosphingobium sp.]|nr:NUDIX domain-containing protein [Novosphingobium sp.]